MPWGAVALGDRHDETQVGADEAVFGVGGGGDRGVQRCAAFAVGQLFGGVVAGFDEA